MNVRDCGQVEKQDLIERMITEKRFDVCALSETKLKGNSEFMMGNIKGVKAVIVSAYGPGSEKTEDERDEFWETLSECVNGFEQSERIVVLGDMNARVGQWLPLSRQWLPLFDSGYHSLAAVRRPVFSWYLVVEEGWE
jgi:hypothetical protein